MEESIQIRRLNDYIVYLKQENETLSEELTHLRAISSTHVEELEATSTKFLCFIDEQQATIESQASEIKDLRATNSRLITDNQGTISELSMLQTLLVQKQTTIDSLNQQRSKKKQEKRERASLMMEEMEQDKVILQMSVRQHLAEVQHLRAQVQNLEYTVKTLKGKIKLNSDMNKSLNSLNCNKTGALDATHLLRLVKGSGFKKKPRFRATVDKGVAVTKTSMEIDADLKSESEDCKLSVIETSKKEPGDKHGQLFTDDEYLDPKEYLHSLDFRNIPIWEHTDERLDTSGGRSKERTTRLDARKLSETYMAPLNIPGEDATEKVSVGVDATDVGSNSIIQDPPALSRIELKETGTATDPVLPQKRWSKVSLLGLLALIFLAFATVKAQWR
jgi:hypothetical protein